MHSGQGDILLAPQPVVVTLTIPSEVADFFQALRPDLSLETVLEAAVAHARNLMTMYERRQS